MVLIKVFLASTAFFLPIKPPVKKDLVSDDDISNSMYSPRLYAVTVAKPSQRSKSPFLILSEFELVCSTFKFLFKIPDGDKRLS